ncbi:Bifunctional purine biosynthesis protein PurH [Mucor velutinosus]|uniref:Bifunctional purine biosynthesis protein PurH n=1 Tax=Mucor velutinosus TaxID=708070 RepID=A0AAN7DMD6_9FUNG|nr:Bifunctional purine biosynthesis protein PurH [Mucor velutinosus]
MSKQPPTNNNHASQFDADLEAIENAMNNIMQGAFSTMFRQLIDSSIFEDEEKSGFPGAKQIGDTITTVFNGRNLDSMVPASTVVEEDGYGGSDFKRLARKSKESRGISTTEETPVAAASRDMVPSSSTATTPSPAGLIFNLLFQQPPAEIFNINRDALPVTHTNSKDAPPSEDKNGGWSFTSTTSRTIYQPDGTQETTITKKSNGVTETIKQIRYADGRTEESREEKSSFWNRLFGSNK